MGNPVGGNVTSNVSGQDVFYEEWMNFVSSDMACIRVCIAGELRLMCFSNYSTEWCHFSSSLDLGT